MVLATFLWAWAPLSNAAADAPNASERELAREKFREGLEAAQATNWNDARDAFERSYELYPRPITLLNLAGARLQTGQLLEAAHAYRRFLVEAKEGREASLRETAERMIVEIEDRIPKVRVRALGVQPDDALVLDGERLSHATIGELLPVNPGTHELSVTRPGHGTVEAEFSIEEREWRTVVLDARPEMWPEDRRAVLEEEVETREGTGTEASPLPMFEEDGVRRDTPRAERDDDGLLDSPWFWITTAALLVGGGILTYVLLTGDSEGSQYEGNLGSIGVN